MRRIGIVLSLLLGAAAIAALALTSAAPLVAKAHPALQAGDGENCVACHTDKETLQELAVEPEEEEELSEGEG